MDGVSQILNNFNWKNFFLTEIKLREIAFKWVNCSYTSFSWNFRGHIKYGYPNIQQSENNTIREPGLEYTPWLSNFLGVQRSCALWLLGLEMTLAERGIYIQNYKNIKKGDTASSLDEARPGKYSPEEGGVTYEQI